MPRPIKRGGSSISPQSSVTQTSENLPRDNTSMAPCFGSDSGHPGRFPGKDNLRLRKPRVEKMRRDRINTCIDQLKLLLETELHQQEPNAKLEKADVLEMTVCFLRRQLMRTPGGLDLLSSVGPSRETSVSAAPPPPPSPSSSLHGLRHQEHQGELLLLAQRDFTSSSSSIMSSSISSTHRPTGSSKSLVWRPW
ncbi:transcription factor HES-2-like [Gadus chalcogrammus]|uniref:transcription factor HES-2-like n=1 Tax=Gadus chalcogrammus TaxID=1042646 RepID=UPI0024C284D9|nr:transcription factor HES-2-like [Gadus chalcogrammus]